MNTRRMYRSVRWLLNTGLLLTVVLTLAGPASVARAASYVVSNLNDSGAGSLRQAIEDANATAGADTITFSVSGTITLTAQLEVTAGGPLLIKGANAIEVSGIGLAGGYGFRVMFVNSGAIVTLEDLTISNGASDDWSGICSPYSCGGGIYNGGTLTISGSVLSGNRGALGGGIYNGGTLTISDSTISGNYGDSSGGGMYNGGTLTISDSTISDNSAGFGGGISNDGTLTIMNSSVSENDGGNTGGGIYNVYHRGTMTISDSTISFNFAEVDAGGIYNGGTLEMSNSRVVANRSNTFAGGISNDGTLHMASSEVTGNHAYRWAGGIENGGVMVINDSSVLGNTTYYYAGGIFNYGTLTVESNSTLSGNDGNYAGGGILNLGALTITQSTLSNNGSQLGGGILNTSTLTLLESTLTSNGAIQGGGILNVGTLALSESTLTANSANQGGGLLNTTSVWIEDIEFGWSGPGMATVSNSTLSGNSANQGGGLYNYGTLEVTASTFSENSAQSGGGIFNEGTATSQNTIVASTTGGNCTNNGSLIDGGGNLSWPDTSCPGLNANPLLDPLQDNGGPTQTLALLPGSPAIDAAVLANCPATDQRGVSRPQGPGCDIGAFELEVVDNFSGFFQPVDNLPTFNIVRAGAAVPVRFSLGGDQGLDIFAAGYPISKRIACESGAPQDGIERTVTAGSSRLSYNATTDTYTYAWKTNAAWAGTCRQLIVRLNDGTEHRANFKFAR